MDEGKPNKTQEIISVAFIIRLYWHHLKHFQTKQLGDRRQHLCFRHNMWRVGVADSNNAELSCGDCTWLSERR